MARISVGCQTITYGDPQHDRFGEIFTDVADGGYQGAEIGFRRLRNLAPATVAGLLESHGLELVASHVGGNLEDEDQADKERSMLDSVIGYLHEIGTARLMYSGLHFESTDQFERDLSMVFRAAEQCRSEGIQLLYHNHDWEFADDWRVYSRLLEDAPESLAFCVDVGWVEKAGMDSLEVLSKVGGRLQVVHFKDFATTGNRTMDTVVLGTGVIPLKKVADWLKEHVPSVWAIAEQDIADGAAGDAVRTNGAYLASVLRD